MAVKRVLLVDDSATVISLEKMVLRDENCEIFTAANGVLAIEAAIRERPDIILLDIVMPVMDGIECVKRLKSSHITGHIPVIMVTTKGNATMVSQAYEGGCDDFITKPIDKVELLQKLRRYWDAGSKALGTASAQRVAGGAHS